MSFAKRAREVEKKRKQEEKRAKRKDPSLRPVRGTTEEDAADDTTPTDDRSDDTNP